jgi:hypothetical protein
MSDEDKEDGPLFKKPDLRKSYEKKEVVKASATQTAELLLDPNAQARMKKTREHHDARSSGIKASPSMTLRRTTGTKKHVELGTGIGKHIQAEETVSIETLLERYLVSSMDGIEFSPVTDLIHEIVTRTNYHQENLMTVGSDITIQDNIFDVTLDKGKLLSDNYHKLFFNSMMDDRNQIQHAIEYKQTWLDEPSSVANACSSLDGVPVRTISATGTPTQFNAINRLTGGGQIPPYNSDGLIEASPSSSITPYVGRSNDQINRCCICGLGEPPKLTDMEHIVSSQLLIWLGINPGLLSGKGFTDDIDWIQKIADKTRGADVIRSMFLPAHAHCNRTIKSEYNPFIVRSNEIQADLQKQLKKKRIDINKTYENIIDEAIYYTGAEQGLSGLQLETHKTTWIGIQERKFGKIAGFLNTVDNMTKTASLQIIQNMWNSIRNNGNEPEITAFKDFITDLLPPMMTRGDNRSIIENILEQFSDPISENLSLLHKKILARFTFCIHNQTVSSSSFSSPAASRIDKNPYLSGDSEKQYSAFSPSSSTPQTPGDSQSSWVGESPPNPLPQEEGKGGGKRTKRRRGRGKSKKKVTRKKRVKRRKTVKKIKRKRIRTRKR